MQHSSHYPCRLNSYLWHSLKTNSSIFPTYIWKCQNFNTQGWNGLQKLKGSAKPAEAVIQRLRICTYLKSVRWFHHIQRRKNSALRTLVLNHSYHHHGGQESLDSHIWIICSIKIIRAISCKMKTTTLISLNNRLAFQKTDVSYVSPLLFSHC